MSKIEPFEKYTDRYENWFNDHEYAYKSELEAVRSLLPSRGEGVEIGVGSGRFAEPLNIHFGVDPSPRMLEIAKSRGIKSEKGKAEALPYEDHSFDFALMVTTICFLDDVHRSFREVYRILKKRGSFLIGFIDRESTLGRFYEEHSEENVFYRVAKFFTTEEVVSLLRETGFNHYQYVQTLFRPLPEITAVEPVESGYGSGAFVVIKAEKTWG